MQGFFILMLIFLLVFRTPPSANAKSPSNIFEKQKSSTIINNYAKLRKDTMGINPQLKLAKLYIINNDFAKAEYVLKPLYNSNTNNAEIAIIYLKVLVVQQKIKQAYWVVKNNHLEHTEDGYIVLGDMAMMDKDYYTARSNYKKALVLDSKNFNLYNKLANSYRLLGLFNTSAHIFEKVLHKNSSNLDAMLGLGYLEIDKKNYKKSRVIFNSILSKNKNYNPAKMAIIESYIANEDNLKALEILKTMDKSKEVNLIMSQLYYTLNMYFQTDTSIILPEIELEPEPEQKQKDLGTQVGMDTEVFRELTGLIYKDEQDLKHNIKKDKSLVITPEYEFFFQQLADEFNLDFHKFGLALSKKIEGNKNLFIEYNVIIYSSGAPFYKNNVVNEFKGGVCSRPNGKLEYRTDLGVKAFEFGGGLITTDSWIKHYFNDNFNLKLGFARDNIEQSYISGVGALLGGVFTGRAVDNNLYIRYEGRLPHQFYTYGRAGYGVINASNMNTNQYLEGLVAVGRNLYNNPKNKWINKVSLDIVSYQTGYQYDELDLFAPSGESVGGYFSPSYFNAETGELKFEGYIKKINLKYLIKAFTGIQNTTGPSTASLAWGISPSISYDINDNVSVNLNYNHFVYADLVRDQLTLSGIIRVGNIKYIKQKHSHTKNPSNANKHSSQTIIN